MYSNCGHYKATGEYTEDCKVIENFKVLIKPTKKNKTILATQQIAIQPTQQIAKQPTQQIAKQPTQQIINPPATKIIKPNVKVKTSTPAKISSLAVAPIIPTEPIKTPNLPGPKIIPQVANPYSQDSSASSSANQSYTQDKLFEMGLGIVGNNNIIPGINYPDNFCNNYCSFMYSGNKETCKTKCIANNCSKYCNAGLGGNNMGVSALCDTGKVEACIDGKL